MKTKIALKKEGVKKLRFLFFKKRKRIMKRKYYKIKRFPGMPVEE